MAAAGESEEENELRPRRAKRHLEREPSLDGLVTVTFRRERERADQGGIDGAASLGFRFRQGSAGFGICQLEALKAVAWCGGGRWSP